MRMSKCQNLFPNKILKYKQYNVKLDIPTLRIKTISFIFFRAI